MSQSQPKDSISLSLAAAHSAVNARHSQTKARLLNSLSDVSPPCFQRPQSTVWRYVAGGLGLSAAALIVVTAIWLVGPASPAEAMERLAKALDQVATYSYRMEEVYISRKEQGRTVRQVTFGRWRTEPVGLYATMNIVEILGTNTAAPNAPKTLVDLEEAHQADRRGIIINHLKEEYWHINEEINAEAIPPGSPQVAVHMVQQRHGRVLRDLGEKKINGQLARGLEIMLDDGQPVSELGPTSTEGGDGQAAEWDWRNAKIEVWIDPKTDLPIEFRNRRQGKDFETTSRFTDLKWNVDFSVGAFDAVVPDGYVELNKLPVTEE